ncbi:MAG: DUF2252 domain-containing protein [Actinomycetota bacterium]|nr:DUF2252 domain-containing protein [Actinomycetota bacterium]
MTELSDLALSTHVRNESVAERVEAGKRARKEHPRSTMGNWEPASNRTNPISMLADQESVRVQELIPIRHARMAVSPFTFYRGTAAVMAHDLGNYPNSGLATQLCGDAHLSNFGVFASPDRSVIFDINDFDETHPGAFDWDVARMVASFYIAATDNQYSPADRRTATLTAATSYRMAMAQYAGMNDLDVWYSRIDAEFLLNLAQTQGGNKAAKNMDRNLAKARSRDRWSAINKLTVEVDGLRQFVDEPPLLTRMQMNGATWEVIEGIFEQYRLTLNDDRRELLRRYRIIDFAHKVVGVGSVGLRAFVVLLQGRDPEDLLVLQVKEAVSSVLEPYTAPTLFPDQGHRVVSGQRLMQAASDAFLGWLVGPAGRHFYVRQLRDMKWSPEIASLSPRGLSGLAQICGKTLARAHARTGDSIKIASYLGTSDVFDESMFSFSERYAAQVDADFTAFRNALEDGTMANSSDENASILQSLMNETNEWPDRIAAAANVTQPQV